MDTAYGPSLLILPASANASYQLVPVLRASVDGTDCTHTYWGGRGVMIRMRGKGWDTVSAVVLDASPQRPPR